jgi:hypothetical protein
MLKMGEVSKDGKGGAKNSLAAVPIRGPRPSLYSSDTPEKELRGTEKI